MKKWLCLMCTFIFMVCMIITVNAKFKNNAVYDGADILEPEEEMEIEKMLDNIRDKYEVDVAIATAVDMKYDDAMKEADAIYDERGYGYGDNYDGILLYISMKQRSVAYVTRGYGVEVFNQNGLDYLDENVTAHLTNDDFYSAFEQYASISKDMLKMAEEGKPYGSALPWYTILIVVGIAFVIALSMMLYKLSLMNTAKNEDYAQNYVKDDSFKLDLSRDIFLYSNITKTKKAQNSNSGSNSSKGGKTNNF